MPNNTFFFEQSTIRRSSDFELRNYSRDTAERRYPSRKMWILHYIGASRIVYDLKTGRWTTAMSPFSLAAWIVFFLAVVAALVWFGLKDVIDDFKKDRPMYQNVHEKLDDGRYRFLSYSAAPETADNS